MDSVIVMSFDRSLSWPDSVSWQGASRAFFFGLGESDVAMESVALFNLLVLRIISLWGLIFGEWDASEPVK